MRGWDKAKRSRVHAERTLYEPSKVPTKPPAPKGPTREDIEKAMKLYRGPITRLEPGKD